MVWVYNIARFTKTKTKEMKHHINKEVKMERDRQLKRFLVTLSRNRVRDEGIFFVYCARLAKVKGIVFTGEINDIVEVITDELVKSCVVDMLNEDIERAKRIIGELVDFDIETLDTYMLQEYKLRTHLLDRKKESGVTELCLTLLDIKGGDNIADICGKDGSVAFKIRQDYKCKGVTCMELDKLQNCVAIIKDEIAKTNIVFTKKSVFEYSANAPEFDKIIGLSYMGLKVPRGNEITRLVSRRSIGEEVSVDWRANEKIIEGLKEGGKGVAVMSLGSLVNQREKDERGYFVENSYIETVIVLPKNTRMLLNITPVIIVFSKGKKDSINMVDASMDYVGDNNVSIIDRNNIAKIIGKMNVECEYSRKVSFEEIANADYSLNPNIYLQKPLDFDNIVSFESVVMNITRGASVTASTINELASVVSTDYQYLKVSDINNGKMEKNLTYLTHIEPSLDKYCIKNNSLLISRSGNPFRIAVAEVDEGKKILASNNIFVIELNSNKVNPHYIKMFLESNAGAKQIEAIAVGTGMTTIGVNSLMKISIPLISLYEQEKIVEEYLHYVDELRRARQRVAHIERRLKNLLDCKMGG